jgi:hypothetical protein
VRVLTFLLQSSSSKQEGDRHQLSLPLLRISVVVVVQSLPSSLMLARCFVCPYL